MFSLKNQGLQKKLIEIKEVIPVESNGQILYRVFNLSPIGYVIITADNNAEPVIGYGLDSNFCFEDAPPALLFLLEEYKKEMVAIIEKNLEADTKINEKWNNYSSDEFLTLKSYSPGTYLLETTWGQENGYNDFCPDDPDTSALCVAGCGPVALAQILHYWGCRVFPDGSKTYTPPNFSNSLTVNFYNQNYDWDAMNHSSADDDNAQLIYHCGVAMSAQYSSSGTATYISNAESALENYFGFLTEGRKFKDNFNLNTWINMLKADIDYGRPIYYRGGGHAWVVDGYNYSDQFHCNWGWDGQYIQNWYTLSGLNPGGNNFNSDQLAILGAEPILDACSGLSGASVICSSNVTYSVSIPTTASVLWSKSTNINQVGGNTGLTFTVNASSSGSGNITATIKNSQGQTFLTRTKDVWVGGPKIDYISGPTYAPNNNWATYYAQPNNSQMAATDYEWALSPTNGNVIYDYGWTADIAFYNAGNYQLVARAQNTCGWGPYTVLGLEVYDSKSLAISPNPTTGETTITIKPASEKELLVSAWDLEIFTPIQALKEKKTRLKGSSTVINTSGWQEGVYVVRVLYNNEIITGKLIVKR